MFLKALQAPRSGSTAVRSPAADAGASYINRIQMHGGGGISTVFSANQITGGVTRPVVMKRSDIDQQAAFQRESRILQCLSAPGRVTAGFVIQLLETYSTSEHNFIVMEKAGINLSGRVKESRRLSIPERRSQLQTWGVQACQVRALLWRAVKACIFSEDGRDVNGGYSVRQSSENFVIVQIAFALLRRDTHTHPSVDLNNSGGGGSARPRGCMGRRQAGQLRIPTGPSRSCGLRFDLR